MGRKWIKLYVEDSLRGTIRFQFNQEHRANWYDLLLLAGDSREDGLISPGNGMSYPIEWIANTLNVPVPSLKATLDLCVRSGRIEITRQGIRILNWKKYQTEYDRQKKYRQNKECPPGVDPDTGEREPF